MCACCAPPCCSPCTLCPAPCPQGPRFNMSAYQLEYMPQCCPPCPPATPRNVTVQQPPRLIVQRKVVYVKKVVQDPKLVCCVKPVTLPHVTEIMKVRRKPVLRWLTQIVSEPQITWCQGFRPDPYVVCCPKLVCSPKDVCQTLLCQPKPQVIRVPQPQEFCVYATGPQTLRCRVPCQSDCPPMPPYLPSPCQPVDPCKALTLGGPCGPRGPCGPCGPCPPFTCDPSYPCLPLHAGSPSLNQQFQSKHT